MKLLHSSRSRIALTIVAICGLVLGTFTAAAWWKLRESRLAALDREMETIGNNLALNARRGLVLADAETRVREHFGKDRDGSWQLAVTDAAGLTSRSQGWPAGINPDRFPHSPDILFWDLSSSPAFRDRDYEPRRGPPGGFPELYPDPEHGLRGPPPDDRFERDRGGPRRPDGPERPNAGGPRLYRPVYAQAKAMGKSWQIGVFGHAGSGTTIRLALDTEEFAPDLAAARRSFFVALPGALILVALGAWLSARRAFAPVDTLAENMQALSFRHPNVRLDAAGADTEFHSIIHSYNTMLDRFERSYQQAARFSADASHELKTPLAVMRGTLEQGLHQCPDGSAEQRTYAGLLDELDQLQTIIESLLLLSRADAGVLATSRSTLELSSWLAPLLEDASLMAEERGITVQYEPTPGIHVAADPVLLTRAVHNLLRNAVAYNHEGGLLRCVLATQGTEAVLTIANTGPPMLEEESALIFQRFRRGTNAGGSGIGQGLGIGLSLSREIALAHGGDLILEKSSGGLTAFSLHLPLMKADAGQS